ncbi:MAG: PIG-L family deacetylase [Terriglobia bacterium]|jgi:LmbE family N-acetylglucosaminyl deacetylase
MLRRNLLSGFVAAGTLSSLPGSEQQAAATGGVVLERPLAGQPHKGKVLLALQAHSDDIALEASGTVAKLIEEGYTGYLVRATNDDMGDSPGLVTAGTIGENVLGNERDTARIAELLGCRRHFDLNYSNHRMADVSLNELICRLILIIRLVKADTVVCWDPWAHDEENPDHYTLAKAVEAACWMAGRAHDYPEQFAAGLEPKEVQDKYYFARRPEITRVVDISKQIEKKVEVNRANVAKGPAGHLGSRLRAELAKRNQRLPLLGDDDSTADRNYIRDFVMTGSRELGRQYGVEYAEAFHYIPPGAAGADRDPRVESYVREHAAPLR